MTIAMARENGEEPARRSHSQITRFQIG